MLKLEKSFEDEAEDIPDSILPQIKIPSNTLKRPKFTDLPPLTNKSKPERRNTKYNNKKSQNIPKKKSIFKEKINANKEVNSWLKDLKNKST